jgi:hypothetical protein
MLLNQLLQQPTTSSQLLVCDPFRVPDKEELVKEVIGLANSDADGPRYILFGTNPGAMEGGSIVGIAEDAMADLKKAHRLISALIDPILHLAFMFDRINGKLVGALEIDGCDAAPFVVGQDFSEELSRGKSWIREGRELRAVNHAGLASISTPETDEKPDELFIPPPISVGFNDQPDCKVLEMSVPDTSNPPFAGEKQSVKEPSSMKKAIKDTLETVTTQILRLRPGYQPDISATTELGETKTLFVDADNHYFYEEKALQLNLIVSNDGEEIVRDMEIELGFPRLPDFDVADHLYTSPFDKRSSQELKNLGYPKVERENVAIMVRNSIGVLAPDHPESAFRCPLRLAVGPDMLGKKIAVHYTLRGKDKQEIGKGRLKIIFGKEFAEASNRATDTD